MLNKVSTTPDVDHWTCDGSGNDAWVQIVFPYKINITGMSIYSRPNDNYNGTVRVYTNSTKATPITNAITMNAGATKYTFTVTPTTTDTLYFYVTNQSAWFGMQNLQITGTITNSIYDMESTSDDYDKIIEYTPLTGIITK